jgi:hypothetical protein
MSKQTLLWPVNASSIYGAVLTTHFPQDPPSFWYYRWPEINGMEEQSPEHKML